MGKSDLKLLVFESSSWSQMHIQQICVKFPSGNLKIIPSSYKSILVQTVHEIHTEFELLTIFLLNTI